MKWWYAAGGLIAAAVIALAVINARMRAFDEVTADELARRRP
jgi:hypothetical protein